MTVLIIIVHVLVCLIMIGVILLQAGKGAEIGAAFGGSSQTIFGSRGATTFLSKLTIGAASLFMLTSLSLSILSNQRSVASSIIDALPPAATTPAPASPNAAGEPAPGEASSSAPSAPTTPATP
ncbi:MAG TPA: preprotein translocase subunit SecG [Nitrospiria bacterium]|nr:preprotein translocase subunit SecG [Nitrospiria bacterium]